jgi:hypothetical protein
LTAFRKVSGLKNKRYYSIYEEVMWNEIMKTRLSSLVIAYCLVLSMALTVFAAPLGEGAK